jgi:hypothetical protein
MSGKRLDQASSICAYERIYMGRITEVNMNELVAKPIIKDQYWVVTDGDKKVGNVLANSAGYEVILNGSTLQFNNTKDIAKQTKITFQPVKSNKVKVEMPYPEYPTTSKTYNNIFDIKRKLHLYTKTLKSKCYHAAGYFIIDQNGHKSVVFCPKYIFIQRYDYVGPFKTEDEANELLNKT